MEKKLFVGNLPFAMSESDLESAFGEFGTVESAVVIRDRETGRARGFGFVEMSNSDEAEAAQRGLDGKEFMGRPIRVNEAKPREDRPRRTYSDRW